MHAGPVIFAMPVKVPVCVVEFWTSYAVVNVRDEATLAEKPESHPVPVKASSIPNVWDRVVVLSWL